MLRLTASLGGSCTTATRHSSHSEEAARPKRHGGGRGLKGNTATRYTSPRSSRVVGLSSRWTLGSRRRATATNRWSVAPLANHLYLYIVVIRFSRSSRKHGIHKSQNTQPTLNSDPTDSNQQSGIVYLVNKSWQAITMKEGICRTP